MSVQSLLGRGAVRIAPVLRLLRRVPIVGTLIHDVGLRLLPRGEAVRIRASGGLCRGMYLDLDPRTGYEQLHGLSEPAVQAALAKFGLEGGVFYDLGSNFGYYTVGIARNVGSNGHVYAFEADPEVADRLERNVQMNDLTNVTLVRAAAWSEAGTVSFSRSDQADSLNRGLGMVVEDGSPGEILSVPAVCLDDFAKTSPPPTLIKSDVEGAEVEVFQGARRVLEQARPVVVCEMHSAENEETLGRMFAELGYRSSVLDEIHVLFEPKER